MVFGLSDASTVAVVIPTHNRPDNLVVAVRSVLDQKIDDGVEVRLVVVDEASNPPAAAALGELATSVLLFRNEQPNGPAAARNQGARATRADYVAFLDDDDRWLPGKIQACLRAFAEHPDAVLVYHRVGYEPLVGSVAAAVRRVPDPITQMLHSQPPHVNGVMVRMPVHQAVEFDETFRGSEDLDYLLRVAMSGPIVELNSVLAVHGAPATAGSAISIEQRIDGRRRFKEKHADLFDRTALAHSDLRIGHQYRQLGWRLAATRAFATAARRRPLWLSPWKGLLAAALPAASVQRLGRLRRR